MCIELEHEPAVFAHEAVPRPVETVHVTLQPVAKGDTGIESPPRASSTRRARRARSSSSTAGRFVAMSAASSATPCAGPEVGK